MTINRKLSAFVLNRRKLGVGRARVQTNQFHSLTAAELVSLGSPRPRLLFALTSWTMVVGGLKAS